MSYDYENRVTGITGPGGLSDTFTYNGLDTRVGKVDANGTHSFLRDGASVTDPVLNDGTAEYTPGISRSAGAASLYYSSDRLGSNTLQTDSSQNVSSTTQYDAFGNLVGSTGTPKGPFGFDGQYGYQTDQDTNLQLLGHRYYDSTTGRFLTRDPVKDDSNWYDYCLNNPLAYTDAQGLQLGKIFKWPLPMPIPQSFWDWLKNRLAWHHHHKKDKTVQPPTVVLGNLPKNYHPDPKGGPFHVAPGTSFSAGGWQYGPDPGVPGGTILYPPGTGPVKPGKAGNDGSGTPAGGWAA